MEPTEMNTRQELERTYLHEADQHVANAEARIAGVRAHIAALEREGADPGSARIVLEALEATLVLTRGQRDMIAQLVAIPDHPTDG
jgi:hypothetical protein